MFECGHVKLELPESIWKQISTSQLGMWEWAGEEMSIHPREMVVEAVGVSNVAKG